MNLSRISSIALLFALAACTASTDDDSQDEDGVAETADALGASSPGPSAADVRAFNHPTKHYAASVRLAGKDRTVYDRTGGVLYAKKVKPFYEGGVRIQRNDDISVGGVRYFWMWGDGDAGVPSGFVSEKELDASDVASKLAKSDFDDDGNGHEVAVGKELRVAPTAISSELRYCRITPKDGANPNGSIETQDFSDYALGGVHFGRLDYAYLSWNLVNVSGGGLNRAVMKAGETFHVGKLGGRDMVVTLKVVLAGTGSAGKCRYVKQGGGWQLDRAASQYAKTSDAYVKWAYGAVGTGKRAVFGWALLEHKEPGRGPVRHLVP